MLCCKKISGNFGEIVKYFTSAVVSPFTLLSVETNLALCLIRDPNCQLGIVCLHTHTHTHAHMHIHTACFKDTQKKNLNMKWRRAGGRYGNYGGMFLELNSPCDLLSFSKEGAERQRPCFTHTILITICFIRSALQQ